jgi:hypothetical protein
MLGFGFFFAFAKHGELQSAPATTRIRTRANALILIRANFFILDETRRVKNETAACTALLP